MSIRFSLLANAMPSFREGTSVEKKVDALQDYQVQLLEYLRYTLQNLDADNFNETGLNEILEPVLVEVKGFNGEITAIKIANGEIRSSVEGMSEEFGELKSTVTQTANSVSAIVSGVGSDGTVTAASIVAAINRGADYDESFIKLSANAVNIDGVVTFTDLANSNPTKTIINGNNITTGEIRAINFVASGDMDGYISNSFVVETEERDLVGRIGYQYVGFDNEHCDKLWIRTESYSYYPNTYNPSIKIEAAGGVSIESYDGHGVFIYDGSGTEWMFKGGFLYKDGRQVL